MRRTIIGVPARRTIIGVPAERAHGEKPSIWTHYVGDVGVGSLTGAKV